MTAENTTRREMIFGIVKALDDIAISEGIGDPEALRSCMVVVDELIAESEALAKVVDEVNKLFDDMGVPRVAPTA